MAHNKYPVKLIIFLFTSIFIYMPVADAKQKEKFYQVQWCTEKGGQIEVVMPDRSRADCLLNDYAVEMDFCTKWAECGMQALHYANMTGKRPMCVLICNPKTADRYKARFDNAVKHLNRYEKPVLIIIDE